MAEIPEISETLNGFIIKTHGYLKKTKLDGNKTQEKE